LRSSLIALLNSLQSPAPGHFLRCLYCHYVFDDQVDAFERQLHFLLQRGRFVDTTTCLRMARGEQPVDGRCFHLSFDDGFRNHFTNAAPVLRRLGIPSLFFVPSAFVDADYETSRHYCMETTDYAGVMEMLRWSDLEQMLADGFDIGSHTQTHARFSDISADPERMRQEFQGSKLELERRLGFTCNTISWPYGTLGDADWQSLEWVRQSGYEACFGAFRGTVMPGNTNLFAIPRHHFEVQWPLAHVSYFAGGHGERNASIPG
jgi:peptidoglycan/xylan/chitin deacetylase (PgdA/CDA1 family)